MKKTSIYINRMLVFFGVSNWPVLYDTKGVKMLNFKNVLRFFPMNICSEMDRCFGTKEMGEINSLEEIRIRVGKPILLKLGEKEEMLNHVVTSEEILEILQHLCDNSIYSYQSQICNGFLTVQGGHRIGITGNVVIKENKVTNISYVSSLNIRIAKQIVGCSNKILKYVLDVEHNSVLNTLIVSSPGGGKTTLLRDLIRKISSGMEQIKFHGINVGVIDERGEIAAMYKGVPQNDIGIRTDVLDNIPKALGMKMMIRSMSPHVIVADEIGSREDVEAIEEAIHCGIRGIFTAHGSGIEDLKANPALRNLMDTNVFKRIIFLENKEVKGVWGMCEKDAC